MKVGTRISDAITVSFLTTSFWSIETSSLLVVACRGKQVACVLDRFGRAEELVVRRRKQALDLPWEDLPGERHSSLDVDAPVDDLTGSVPGRAERLADVQKVMPKLRQPAPALLRRPAVDVLLELVDLFVHVVEQIQEALGDVVDEMERDLPRRQLVLVGVADVAHALGRERFALAGRLADGHDPLDASGRSRPPGSRRSPLRVRRPPRAGSPGCSCRGCGCSGGRRRRLLARAARAPGRCRDESRRAAPPAGSLRPGRADRSTRTSPFRPRVLPRSARPLRLWGRPGPCARALPRRRGAARRRARTSRPSRPRSRPGGTCGRRRRPRRRRP